MEDTTNNPGVLPEGQSMVDPSDTLFDPGSLELDVQGAAPELPQPQGPQTPTPSVNFGSYKGTGPLEIQQDYADAKDYIGYSPYFANIEHRDAQAARNQSSVEKLGNGLYQGVVGEVIGGTLQGLGAFGMLADSERNVLFELGEAIRESTEEANIFEKEPGRAFAFNDVGWWAKNMPSMLSTISMFIPGAAIGKGASLVGRGLSAMGRAGRVASKVSKARKSAGMAGEAFDEAAALAAARASEAARLTRIEGRAQTIGTGIGMRHAENIREAVDVAQRAEQDFIDNTATLEDMRGTEAWRTFVLDNGKAPENKNELAKYVGGAAAKRSYAVNSSNLVFDIAQASLIFKPFGAATRGAAKKATAKEIEEAAEKLGKKVVEDASKKSAITRLGERFAPVAPLASQMVSEGAEEAVNFIGSEEGFAYAQELRGVDRGDFGDRLNEYVNDSQLWESAFFGAIGGGIFQAFGTSYGKKQNALLEAYTERENLVKGYAEALRKADSEEQILAIKNEFIHNLGLTAAQQGRVDQLVQQLESDEFMDSLVEQGFGTKEEMEAKRAEMIEQVLAAEEEYKGAIAWAQERGLSGMAMGTYLRDTMSTHARLFAVNKRLQELEGTTPLNDQEQYAVKKGLLDMLEKNHKKNRAYKPVIEQLKREVAEAEEAGVDAADVDASSINTDAVDALTLGYLKQALDNERGIQRSDRATGEYIKRGNRLAKRKLKELRQKQKEQVSQEKDVQKLEDIVTAARKNKDKELERRAQDRLDELRAQEEQESQTDQDIQNETTLDNDETDGDNQLSLFSDDDFDQTPDTPADEDQAPESDDVSDAEFNEFVDTGVVSDERVQQIAQKIKQGEQLTERELAMREQAADQIEALLQEDAPTQRDPIESRLEQVTTQVEKDALLEELQAEKKELQRQKRNLRAKAKRREDSGQTEEANQLRAEADALVEQLAEVNADIKAVKAHEVQEEVTPEEPDTPVDEDQVPDEDADEDAQRAFDEERARLYELYGPSQLALGFVTKKDGFGIEHSGKQLAALIGIPEMDEILKTSLEGVQLRLDELLNMSDAELLGLRGVPLKRLMAGAGVTLHEHSVGAFRGIQKAIKDGYMDVEDLRSVLRNTKDSIAAIQNLQEQAKAEEQQLPIETPTRSVQLQLNNTLQRAIADALEIGVAHTPGFNDPFYEWKLQGSNTSLTLTTQNADAYKALQLVSQGRGNIIIRKSEQQYETSSRGVVDFGNRSSNILRKAQLLKKRGIVKDTLVDASNLQETDYQIIARIGNEEVVIGWVPLVKTVLDQAARLQEDYNIRDKGMSRQAPRDTYGRIIRSGDNSHIHALEAVNTADKILALREYLDSAPGDVDITAAVAPKTALDGKSAQGALLRPGPLATATIASDPNIMSAIEEHGIGVLMRDENGQPYLYDPINKRKIDGMPYQDGVRYASATKREPSMGYGFGYVFIPVQDPLTSRVMWVRVNDRPILSAMGSGKDRSVVGLLADALKPALAKGDTDAAVTALSMFTAVRDERGQTAEGPINPKFTGVVVKPSGQIVIYEHGRTAAQIKRDGTATKNLYTVLGRMPYMMEVKASDRGDINLQEDLGGRTLLDGFLESAKLPVASMKDAQGNVIGYTHTLGPVRRPTGPQDSSFFPDTQQVSMPIQIEGFAPEGVNVVEPDAPEVTKPADAAEDLFDGLFLTVDRAAAGPIDRRSTPGEQKEAEDWFAKNLPHVPFRRVKGLIRRGGKTGYGIWHEGMVTVSDVAVAGTEFHEAFHAVMDAYLDPKRKAKILAEAKKKYGDKLSDIELEERLAESFREYMLTKGKSMQEKSAIRRFFSELYELVRAMFTGEYQAMRVMQSINNGKYTYKPDSRTQDFRTKWKQAPAMSAQELSELEGSIPFVVNRVVSSNVYAITGMSNEEADAHLAKRIKDPQLRQDLIAVSNDLQRAVQTEDDGTSTVDKQLLKDIAERTLQMTFRKGGLMEGLIVSMHGGREQVPEGLLDRLADNEQQLIERFANDKQMQRDLYDMLAVDSSTGTSQLEQYGGVSMQEINPMDKVPAVVKAFISSKPYLNDTTIQAIHEAVRAGQLNNGQQIAERVGELLSTREGGLQNVDRLSTFGLPRRQKFREVYPFLLHHLHDSTSPQNMLSKMLKLAQKNPNIAVLVNDLKKEENEDLLTKFYVAMKRAKTDEINVVERRQEDGTMVLQAVPSGVLSPQVALKMRYQDGVLSRIRLIRQDPNNVQRLKEYAANPAKHTPQGLLTMMVSMGFPNNDGIRMFTQSLSTAGISQVMGQLTGIATESKSKDQSRKLMAFIGNNNLADADMSSVQPRYRNHKGKYVYAFMNPSYATEEIDRMMDKNYMRSRVGQDARLQNSEWGMQNQVQYKRFGGLRGVPYNKMTPEQRIQYDIGVLQAGFVPIPTPSDADNSLLMSTSWMGHHLPKKMEGTELEDHRDRILMGIWKSESTSNDAKGSIPGLKEARTPADARAVFEAFRNREVDILIAKLADSKVFYTRKQLEEYVMATYVSHWNTAHWLGGNFNEFQKTDKKGNDTTVVNFQKRFKHILSPGQTSADQGDFRVVTVQEPVKKTTFGKLGEVKIDRADGQSYVTLEHYRRILKAHGEWNPHVDRVIDKAIKGETLNAEEAYLLKPYKPFYYGRVGSKGHQIKNSVVPLLPASKDPELRKMLDWMNNTKIDGKPIDQVNMASAHKVGLGEGQLVTMWNDNNEFVTPENFTADQVNVLPMTHHRNQVHVTEHMSNSDTISFGSQASKLITSNLRQYGSITHNGKEVAGETMIEQIVAKEQEMLEHKLAEMRGAVFTKDGNVDQTKIRKWIADNLGEGTPDAVQQVLASGGSINHALIEGPIVQAIKSSFQNEFKKMRVAGGMQVQISDLGRSGIDGSLRGMRVENKTVQPAEIKTSRKFLPKKYRNMSIEQIKAVDPEALQMIVYRVPAEGKNSMAVVEVVEFLPEGQDGMIVPAEFVHQMGSDFDIDKLFVTWKFGPNQKGQLSPYKKSANEYYDMMKSVLMDPNVVQNEVLVPQGFDTIKAFRNSVKAQNVTRNLPTGGTIDQYIAKHPYSVLTHLQLTNDNIAGNGLKGIAAINNVFWINMQREGLRLEFGGTTYDFSKISRDMLLWNAESVAASMDGAKDPVWGEMGINQNNFQAFQDLVMLNHLSGQEAIARSARSAWAVITDPYVADLIAGRVRKKELDKLIENGDMPATSVKNVMKYNMYLTSFKPVLELARTHTRFQENRLQDMDNNMLQTLLTDQQDDRFGNQLVARLTDSQGKDASVLDLNVNQANANIVRATANVLAAMGVGFYTKELAQFYGMDYIQYQRASAKSSAEMWLGSKATGEGGPMGVRKANTERMPFDPAVPEDWTLQNFLEFFKTPEGRKLVLSNPDLQYVVDRLYPRSEMPYKATKNGEAYVYDRINVVNLDDPSLVKDFKDAWTRLMENGQEEMEYNGVNIANALGRTMVDYEAARSGFKFGVQYLTSALPDGVVESLQAPESLMSFVGVRAYNLVTQPGSAEFASGDIDQDIQRNAARGRKPLRTQNRVYFSFNSEGQNVRTFVTLDPKLSGSVGLRSMQDLEAEAISNIERAEAIANPKKKKSKLKFSNTETSQTTKEKVDMLKSKFAANGVNVEVVFDPSMDEAGDVEFDGSTGVIRLHPNKLGSDTVIHEFGHIYIEMLGYNNPTVQAAIEQLQDTELYAEVEKLYPELSKRELDMEVLATAIGREGAGIFTETKQQSKFKTLLNKIFRAIGKMFGREPNFAKELARDMMSTNKNLQARQVKFKAQQRIAKNLAAADLAMAVSDEIAERVNHMRRLGATTEQQKDMLERWSTSAFLLRTEANMKEVSLERLSQEIEDTLKDINDLMRNVDGYLAKVSTQAEFTQADVEFFNTAYQMLQMTTTFSQAVKSLDADADPQLSRDVVARFKSLDARLNTTLTELDKKVADAVSNKMKAQNFGDEELAAIETNIFHLAGTDLAKMVTDSSVMAGSALGMKEQKNIILQLTDKLIKRVVQSSEMEANQAISRLNSVLDTAEKEGVNLEDLIDDTGKAFLSPVNDAFWEARKKAADQRIFDAENMDLEYTADYYKGWKYAPKQEDIDRLENLVARLEEAKRNKTLTEEDEVLLADTLEDLDNMRVKKGNFLKFHEPMFDMEAYNKDRNDAKRESKEALQEFDQAFTHPNGNPKFKTKYHTGFKVRDRYINKDYTGSPKPKAKWESDKYKNLSDAHKAALTSIMDIMQEAYGKEHNFFSQRLLPQVPVGEKKTVKERIKEVTSLEPTQSVVERQDSVGNRVFVRSDLKMMTRAEGKINTNLREVLPEFLKQAHAAKAANQIETFALATRDQLSQAELVSAKRGRSLFRKEGKSETGDLRIKGAQSESLKVLEHQLQGLLGQGWTDKVKYDGALKNFLAYNSFMGIGLNFSAWANNWWYGSTQQWLETWGGGNMWSRADMRRARKTVGAHIVELVRTRGGNKVSTNKTVGLLNFFDVTMDQRELPVGGAELSAKLNDMAYIGQTLGEIGMQSQVALSMMYNQKVRLANGSEVSIMDALDYNTETGAVTIPDGAKMIKADGQEVPLTMQELGAFKEKTISVLQKIHGAYNKEDIGRFHRHWVGQLVFQFRKWVPLAVKRRFGEEGYNQAREAKEIGWYTALWKDVVWKSIAGESSKRFRFYGQYKAYENQPHVQAAIRKAVAEHVATLVVAAMATLAHSLIELDGDDDDELFLTNDEFYKAKLLYHLDRLEMELAQYTPAGVVDFATKFGADPAPGVRTVKNLFKFSQQLGYAISPLHDVETFQGGAHYGDNKLSTYGLRLVPGIKQFKSLQDSANSYQVYRLS